MGVKKKNCPGRPLAGFFLLHLKVIFPRLNLQRVFFINICFFYFAKYNYGDIIIDAYMHMPGVPVLGNFRLSDHRSSNSCRPIRHAQQYEGLPNFVAGSGASGTVIFTVSSL